MDENKETRGGHPGSEPATNSLHTQKPTTREPLSSSRSDFAERKKSVHARGAELARIALELHGCRITATSRHFTTCCPWRRDQNPSLDVLRFPDGGTPSGTWLDRATNESGDVIALVAKLENISPKGGDFARLISRCEELLSIHPSPHSRPEKAKIIMLGNTPSRKELARNYAIQETAWEECGCTFSELNRSEFGTSPVPIIRYPIRLPGGEQTSVFRTIARDLSGKRIQRPTNVGDNWQLGLFFPKGPESLRGKQVIVSGGFEKAILADAAGFASVSVPNGEGSPLKPEALTLLLESQPAGIVYAYDALEGGMAAASSTVTSHPDLDVRYVDWPEDRRKGWDLNDEARVNGLESLQQLLGNAPVASAIDSPEASSDGPDFVDFVDESSGSRVHAWPVLVPIPEPTACPLPTTKVFPKKARFLAEYVSAVSVSLQVDPGMVALPVLVSLAAAMPNFAVRANSDWVEPTCLYGIVSAASGERKSPVRRIVAAPFDAYERALAAESQDERRKIRVKRMDLEAERKRNLRRDNAASGNRLFEVEQELDELPSSDPPRLMVDDCTGEALKEAMAKNRERMFVFVPEGHLLETIAGKYKGGTPDLSPYLEGYSEEPIRTLRIGRSASPLEKPRLSVMILAQDDAVRALFSESLTGRGLSARFIYCVPGNTIGWRTQDPPTIPEKYTRVWSVCINGLLDRTWKQPSDSTSGELTLNHAAKETFLEFSKRCETERRPEGRLASIPEWGRKIEGLTLRIAGVLTVAAEKCPTEIDAWAVDAAIAWSDWAIDHALVAYRVIGGVGEVRAMKAVVDWIVEEKLHQFETRMVHRKFEKRPNFRKADEVRSILRRLAELGYLREVNPEPHGYAGRPSGSTWLVNPEVHSQRREDKIDKTPPE